MANTPDAIDMAQVTQDVEQAVAFCRDAANDHDALTPADFEAKQQQFDLYERRADSALKCIERIGPTQGVELQMDLGRAG